jgi:hypothetical protein
MNTIFNGYVAQWVAQGWLVHQRGENWAVLGGDGGPPSILLRAQSQVMIAAPLGGPLGPSAPIPPRGRCAVEAPKGYGPLFVHGADAVAAVRCDGVVLVHGRDDKHLLAWAQAEGQDELAALLADEAELGRLTAAAQKGLVDLARLLGPLAHVQPAQGRLAAAVYVAGADVVVRLEHGVLRGQSKGAPVEGLDVVRALRLARQKPPVA